MNFFLTKLNKPLLCSWVLVILSLSLILKSGLYSDDAFKFPLDKVPGSLTFSQIAAEFYKNILDDIGEGRLTLLDLPLYHIVLHAGSTLLIYKLLLLGANLLAVFLFTRFLKVLNMSDWIPFALLLYCCAIQFYPTYHDSYTALGAKYPLITIFIFSSVILFQKYLDHGKVWTLLGAIFFTLIGILNGEMAFVIYPIMILLLISDRRNLSKKIILFSPHLILLIAYVGALVIVRRSIVNYYPGVVVNLNPQMMLNVFKIQVTAAIPITGYYNMEAIPMFVATQLSKVYPLILLCAGAFAGLLLFDRDSDYKNLSTQRRIIYVLIGFVLFLVPAAMIMTSKKYQEESVYGIGYLQVYIQDFGFVLLLVLLFDFIFSRIKNSARTARSIVFVLFFMISILTLLRNNYMINIANNGRATPVYLYYKSIKNGILNDCENESVIVIRSNYFWGSTWDCQPFIDQYYKKKFYVVSSDDFNITRSEAGKNYYLLEHDPRSQSTLLFRLLPEGKKEVKRINYSVSDEFSYFDLISKPL